MLFCPPKLYLLSFKYEYHILDSNKSPRTLPASKSTLMGGMMQICFSNPNFFRAENIMKMGSALLSAFRKWND